MGKLKRQKQNKKSMTVYNHGFGFRQPYQVLVDGNFIHVARLTDKNLDEYLSLYLGGDVRIMTTYCVYAELKKLGPDMRPSAAMAKKLEKRRCTHSPAVTAAECIKEIIGETNEHNYCVATQDVNLRVHLRDIPGVPLLYINKSVMILEPVSKATLKAVEENEIQKTKPREFELLMKKPDDETKIFKKLKKPKAPNPLSVKKAKKVVEPVPSGPKKRKRLRKSTTDATSNQDPPETS